MDFEGYLAQHERALFRFAVVLSGGVLEAEDLMAQVLSVAFERWATVSAAQNVHAYVRRMLVNEFLGRRRRAALVTVRDDVADLVDRARPAPDHADGVADRQRLRAELDRLPRKQRAAVVLRFYEDLPFSEIAEALGSSEVSVRSNLSRALATLRVEFAEHPEASPYIARGLT